METDTKTVWQRVKTWLPPIFACVAVVIATCFLVDTVRDRRQEIRIAQAAKEAKADKARICRNILGLSSTDVFYSYQKLVMMCGHDVIDQETAKGVRGSVAAERAWNQCMPKLDACEEALR